MEPPVIKEAVIVGVFIPAKWRSRPHASGLKPTVEACPRNFAPVTRQDNNAYLNAIDGCPPNS